MCAAFHITWMSLKVSLLWPQLKSMKSYHVITFVCFSPLLYKCITSNVRTQHLVPQSYMSRKDLWNSVNSKKAHNRENIHREIIKDTSSWTWETPLCQKHLYYCVINCNSFIHQLNQILSTQTYRTSLLRTARCRPTLSLLRHSHWEQTDTWWVFHGPSSNLDLTVQQTWDLRSAEFSNSIVYCSECRQDEWCLV